MIGEILKWMLSIGLVGVSLIWFLLAATIGKPDTENINWIFALTPIVGVTLILLAMWGY